MSAMNRHTICITGTTLRDLSERAAGIFDAYFNREIRWEVTRFDSEAHMTELRNGAGEVAHSEVTSWSATIDAEAVDLFIGASQREPAMLFRPLGT